jgi:hypothetical protein
MSDRGDVAAVVVPNPVLTSGGLKVTARMDVHLYTPMVQSFIPSPVPVQASVEMPR